MLTKDFTIIGIISLMMLVLSCSEPTLASESEQSLLQRNWGRSLESIRYQQMLNPEADKNLDPVLGLDGNASDNNVNKYQESFKATEQKESETILKLQ